jgi:hypothetical protein
MLISWENVNESNFSAGIAPYAYLKSLVHYHNGFVKFLLLCMKGEDVGSSVELSLVNIPHW